MLKSNQAESIGLRILVLTLIVVIAGFTMVGLVVPFVLIYLTPLAIPYTIIATIFAVKNRKAAKKAVLQNDFTVDDTKVSTFSSSWQKNTLALNIVLAVIFVVFAGYLLASVISPFAEDIASSENFLIFVLGAITFVSAGLMIRYNAPFIYRKKRIQDEEYGLLNRTENWKLIQLNRRWSWVTWYVYAISYTVAFAFFMSTY